MNEKNFKKLIGVAFSWTTWTFGHIRSTWFYCQVCFETYLGVFWLLFKWQNILKNSSLCFFEEDVSIFANIWWGFQASCSAVCSDSQGMGSETELLLWSTGFNEGFQILKGGITAAFPHPGPGLSASLWCCENFTWDCLKLFLQQCCLLVWRTWKFKPLFCTALQQSIWVKQGCPVHPKASLYVGEMFFRLLFDL